VTPLSKKLGAKPGAQVTVLFTTSAAELEQRFPTLKATLARAEALWIAWPKKAAKIETDLDFGHVQAVGLAAGLVDNKSCSIERRRTAFDAQRGSYDRRNSGWVLRALCWAA
jgi:hypothetical protein